VGVGDDISKFFDTMNHEHLLAMLKRRVCDGVVVRAIGKWLKAGVMEGAMVHFPEEGSPQGGVISPLLSNIYLHEALDAWFEREIKPRLKAAASLVRYADDAVLVFADKHDAERVYTVLPKRFAKYGLALHPEKTRLISYRKPGVSAGNPGTFDFLGFTHYWGKSRKGYWVMKRKTAKKRLKRAIVCVNRWCRINRHEPLREQWKTLCAKVRGHYQYYGVICNFQSLSNFLWKVKWSWRKWLGWRSGGKEMCWERFAKLLNCYPLPMPKICHSGV
jgi:group II intron reverse transcriptase/maturase